MSGAHACSGMPRGVSVSDCEGGWHVHFAHSYWRREIAYCPFCGKALADCAPLSSGECRRGKKGKAVRCLDTGEVFPTIKAAAQAHGVSDCSIINVCKGKQKKAKEERWEFA